MSCAYRSPSRCPVTSTSVRGPPLAANPAVLVRTTLADRSGGRAASRAAGERRGPDLVGEAVHVALRLLTGESSLTLVEHLLACRAPIERRRLIRAPGEQRGTEHGRADEHGCERDAPIASARSVVRARCGSG